MTALKPFYVYLLDDLSDLILCTFSTLPEVKENTAEPIFVLAHIMIPHPPFIFGPNGESITPDSLDLGLATDWFDKESATRSISSKSRSGLSFQGSQLSSAATSTRRFLVSIPSRSSRSPAPTRTP